MAYHARSRSLVRAGKSHDNPRATPSDLTGRPLDATIAAGVRARDTQVAATATRGTAGHWLVFGRGIEGLHGPGRPRLGPPVADFSGYKLAASVRSAHPPLGR